MHFIMIVQKLKKQGRKTYLNRGKEEGGRRGGGVEKGEGRRGKQKQNDSWEGGAVVARAERRREDGRIREERGY